MRQPLGSLRSVGLALAKGPDPDSRFSVVVNDCGKDGNHSMQSSSSMSSATGAGIASRFFFLRYLILAICSL